jgi:lysozyme
MTWPIDLRGVALIKEAEGLRLKAYLCPASKWTVGYGATGSGIGPDTVWTAEQAEQDLRKRLTAFTRNVQALCTVAPTPTQLAAMGSLAYNIGLGAFRHSSVLRHHNAGRTAQAAESFGKWVKATVDGELVTLPGLVTRRAREAELYLSAS